MKHIKQRNRLLKRKGKIVKLTEACEGMLLRAHRPSGVLRHDEWLFTVQDGHVHVCFPWGWSHANHDHWFDPITGDFVIIDTNFKG